MKEIIAPITAASATKKLHINSDRYVSVGADNLAGAEEVTFDVNMGGNWEPLAPAVKLDASTNVIQLAGPNTYRINKDATAGACGVYACGDFSAH